MAQVLVTRAAHQTHSLCEALSQAGHHALCCPALDIVPLAHPELASACTLRVVLSAHAVRFAAPSLWQAEIDTIAIGEATAAALAEIGVTAAIPDTHTSEGVLALIEHRFDASQHHVAIISGAEGRDWLPTALRARGWRVDLHAVYRRQCPTHSDQKLQQWLTEQAIDIVLCGSDEALTNLLQMSGPVQRRLVSLPLIVQSQRNRRFALDQGFTQVIVPDCPGDSGQLAALHQFTNI